MCIHTLKYFVHFSFILNDFKMYHIDVSLVTEHAQCSCPTSVVIGNQTSGSRTILHMNRFVCVCARTCARVCVCPYVCPFVCVCVCVHACVCVLNKTCSLRYPENPTHKVCPEDFLASENLKAHLYFKLLQSSDTGESF